MMREILFRGKRLDNGEWIEGDFIHSAAYPERAWITECKTLFNRQICDIGIREVDPATVGQYAGVTDRRGTKIFEGDRVIVPMYRMERPVPNIMKGTVEWKNGAFHVTWDDEAYGSHFLGYLEGVEVISNLELLEGGGQCLST